MEYLEQLRGLGVRLAKANAALMTWDEIAARDRLPEVDRGSAIEPPSLSPQALKLQLIFLVADMSRLQQEICAAPVLSAN